MIEIDLGPKSEPGGSKVEVGIHVGMRRLEDAIHGIVARRCHPDWILFDPGSSSEIKEMEQVAPKPNMFMPFGSGTPPALGMNWRSWVCYSFSIISPQSTGGLGDVARALPKALAKIGHFGLWFDNKRVCRYYRRNVIREFKELKELKRIRLIHKLKLQKGV